MSFTITSSDPLVASGYEFIIPPTATIQGIEVSVTGNQVGGTGTLMISPFNAVLGAESDVVPLTGMNGTYTFGSPTDLWRMPSWISQAVVTNPNLFGFQLVGSVTNAGGSDGVDVVVDTINTAGSTTIATPSATPSASNDLAIFSAQSRSGYGSLTAGAAWSGATAVNVGTGGAEGAVYVMPLSSMASLSGAATATYAYGWISHLILLNAVPDTTPALINDYGTTATVTAGSASIGGVSDTAGNALVVFVDATQNTVADTQSLTISDSENNTYYQIADTYDSVWPNRVVAFIALNIAGSGSNTITISNAVDFPVSVIFTVLQVSNITSAAPTTFSVSEVKVKVYYQTEASYLKARDINSWGDNGVFGANNGTPYDECYITVGSITLSQPGARMFPLQHIVGYFDAVGTLNNGGSSYPDIWILPNEVSDTKGIGFVYLPEIVQEPPEGQNEPSTSMLALRWPLNMMNSKLASQFIHHLQVKIQFEPECAPNTIKALAFKENQE